ncbi:hypothetical protein LDENG_00264090, partial [Lucifuga dentata]
MQREAMLLLKLLLMVLLTKKGKPVCCLLGRAEPPELIKAGDFILGGIFTFRTSFRQSEHTFRTLPSPPKCM